MNEPPPDGESLPGPLLFGSRHGGFGRRRRGPRYCAWGRGTTTSTRGPRTFQVTVHVLGVSAHGVGASVQGRSLSVEDVLTGFRRRGIEAPGHLSFGTGRFSLRTRRFSFGTGRLRFRTGTGGFGAGPGTSGRGNGSGGSWTTRGDADGPQSLPRVDRGVETRVGRIAAGARLRLPLAPATPAALADVGLATAPQVAQLHGARAGRASGQDGPCADHYEPGRGRKRRSNRRLMHCKPLGLEAATAGLVPALARGSWSRRRAGHVGCFPSRRTCRQQAARRHERLRPRSR